MSDLAWKATKPHLRLLRRPLPLWLRFVIALFGSGMLFSVFFFLNYGSRNIDLLDPDLAKVFASPHIGTFQTGIFGAVLSLLFAALVGVIKTRLGPVRLFLAGLFVPALAVKTVQVTWDIESLALLVGQ